MPLSLIECLKKPLLHLFLCSHSDAGNVTIPSWSWLVIELATALFNSVQFSNISFKSVLIMG